MRVRAGELRMNQAENISESFRNRLFLHDFSQVVVIHRIFQSERDGILPAEQDSLRDIRRTYQIPHVADYLRTEDEARAAADDVFGFAVHVPCEAEARTK